MQSFFPGRTRKQLRAKFFRWDNRFCPHRISLIFNCTRNHKETTTAFAPNSEEKQHPELVKISLSTSLPLGECNHNLRILIGISYLSCKIKYSPPQSTIPSQPIFRQKSFHSSCLRRWRLPQARPLLAAVRAAVARKRLMPVCTQLSWRLLQKGLPLKQEWQGRRTASGALSFLMRYLHSLTKLPQYT
jgi:hypothetical protein